MRQTAAMPHLHTHFLATCFSAGLLVATVAPNAVAQPVIDWVTPPVWMQTQTENTSALPGTTLIRQTWISTGRGGKAMIRLGGEQVEINENSLWEWAGQNDGSTGNAVQGGMRVSTAAARSPAAADAPSADQPIRLHQNAPWALVLDAGKDQGGAEGLVNFLRNSGYPVSEAQRIKRFFGDKWQIWLSGFISGEQATSMGNGLVALAPGILGAVARRVAAEELAAAVVAASIPVLADHADTGAPTGSVTSVKPAEEAPEEVRSPVTSPSTRAPAGRR